MLHIDSNGMVIRKGVILRRFPNLETGDLTSVSGIVVHQTDSYTAASTLAAYAHRKEGAHFLIDKDGTVYQTASLRKRVSHVGKLKARCIAEHKCVPGEEAKIMAMSYRQRNRYEHAKPLPDRYPGNSESIGIELVGKATPPPPGQRYATYEPVTADENRVLAWLVRELCLTFGIKTTEIFRHPLVSEKTPTEASTARW